MWKSTLLLGLYLVAPYCFLAGQPLYAEADPGAPPPSVPLPSLEARPLRERFEASYRNLEKMEDDLIRSYDELRTRGIRADIVMGRVRKTLDSFTDHERQLVLEGKEGELSPEARSRADGLKRYLLGASRDMTEFQQKYDRFNNAKIDFMMDKYHAIAKGARDELMPRVSRAQWDELDALYEKYQQNRDKFGTRDDTLRLDAIRGYFAKFDKIWQRMGLEQMTLSQHIVFRAQQLGKLVQWVKELAGIGIGAPATYLAIRRKGDLLAAMLPGLRGMLRANGLTAEALGAEKIPTFEPKPGRVFVADGEKPVVLSVPSEAPARKTVNIITPPHTGDKLDAAVGATLGLKKFTVITTFTHMLPDHLGKPLEENDQIVSVGGDRKANPIKRLKELIASGKVENVVLLPEGNRPDRMSYAGIALQHNWSRGIVRLLGEGRDAVNTNLVNVTFPRNYRLANDFNHGEGDRMDLRAVVSDPVPWYVVDYMFSIDDPKFPMIPTAITRDGWMAQFHADDPTRLVGMPRLETLDRKMAAYHLRRNESCEAVFQRVQGNESVPAALSVASPVASPR